MPSQAKTMFSEFRRLLASGPFPQVFSGIGAAHLFAVSPPDPAVLNSPGYLAARSRVLKVAGHRAELRPQHRGIGLRLRAGSRHDQRARGGGRDGGADGDHSRAATQYHAQVVLYDPQVDIAVLYVPGLNLTPLQFDDQAQAGSSAVVAGYPLDHALHRRCPRGSAAPRTPSAPTSTRPGRSTGRSSRSGRRSSRVTRAGRCSARPARCTAWCSRPRWTPRTPGSRSPRPRSPPTRRPAPAQTSPTSTQGCD